MMNFPAPASAPFAAGTDRGGRFAAAALSHGAVAVPMAISDLLDPPRPPRARVYWVGHA